jgi:hypothetical protein
MMAGTKRRAPGDGGLFKRKSDDMWIGSVEIPSADGKRRQKRVSSKDYRTAKAKLDDLRAQIRDGHIAISSTTTVQGWLRRWVDEIRGPHIRPKTFDYYDEAIRLHICPQIVRGGTKVVRATPAGSADVAGCAGHAQADRLQLEQTPRPQNPEAGVEGRGG